MKCIVVLWILLVYAIYAMDFDDNMNELQRSQLMVENNNQCSMCIGIRFNTSAVVAFISKSSNDSSIRSKSSKFLVLDHALVSIVAANESDYRIVRQCCLEFDSEHRVKKGDSISAGILTLWLANDVQSSLQNGEKPLSFNALVVSTDEIVEHNSNSGGIVKVDMSGNFEKYRAVSIGYLSSRVNRWLETRGVYLASQILQQRPLQCHDNSSCPYLKEHSSTLEEDADIQSCISILWDCLHENIGLNNLNQSFTVELSSVQQQRRTNHFRRILPRAGHFFKPAVVPSQVFSPINTTTTEALLCTTEEYSDNCHTGSTRLFRWWRRQREAAIKSGTTKLQWRKLH